MLRFLLTAGVAMVVLFSSCVSRNVVAGGPSRIMLNPTADPATSQTVTWRTVGVTSHVEATAEVRDSDGHTATVDATVQAQRHIGMDPAISFSATFEDLSPVTEYSYRVVTNNNASDWHDFTTAVDSDDPFTFTWYADGQEDLTEQWAPIVGLTTQAFPNSELTLQTGDLVDNSIEDEWDEWFEITDGQRQSENWLPAVGNHEYESDSLGSYWNANFTLPSNGPPRSHPDDQRRELIATHLNNRAYYVDYQGVRYITLSTAIPEQSDLASVQDSEIPELSDDAWQDMYFEVQADWLDDVLASSQATWNIVQLHHPIFSVAEDRDNPAVRQAILPIVQQQDVDLVLSGHDHTYSRAVFNEDETVLAVSNSGPKYYDLATDDSYDWSDGGTQLVEHEETSVTAGIRVTPDSLAYEAIAVQQGADSSFDGELGDTVDAFTITKNNDGTTTVTNGIDERVASGL